MLALTIPAEPRPLARPRVVKGRTYTPKESEAHKRLVAFHMKRAMMQRARGVFPMQGPVSVRLDFFLGDKRRVDVDNLAKLCLDAMTLARVWADDSQVVSLTAHKYGPSASPRTTIAVEYAQATTQPEAASYPRGEPDANGTERVLHAGRDMSGTDGT